MPPPVPRPFFSLTRTTRNTTAHHRPPPKQQYQALRWLAAGLGLFGGAGLLAARLDKRSEIPFTPREYPFDGLSAELAGSKGVGPRD